MIFFFTFDFFALQHGWILGSTFISCNGTARTVVP